MKSKPNLSSINIDAAVNRSSMEDAIQGYKQAIESKYRTTLMNGN